MKNFGLLFVVLFAQTVFAQTAIDIQPQEPIDCLKRDHPHVNQLGQTQKIQEDEASVTFAFKTTHGFCKDLSFQPYAMSASASLFTDRNRLILFQKNPVQSKLQSVSTSDALVTLTFDKTKIFKKRDVSTFTMAFYPDGFRAPYTTRDAWGRQTTYYFNDMRFYWNIVLTRLSPTESDLKIQIVNDAK